MPFLTPNIQAEYHLFVILNVVINHIFKLLNTTKITSKKTSSLSVIEFRAISRFNEQNKTQSLEYIWAIICASFWNV